MSKITDNNSNFKNEAIIKYISCNDVLAFDNRFKITKCSKCVNWCNDKLSSLYFNWRQDEGSPRNHICDTKHKAMIDNNGNIISVERIKDGFVERLNINRSTIDSDIHSQTQQEKMKEARLNTNQMQLNDIKVIQRRNTSFLSIIIQLLL